MLLESDASALIGQLASACRDGRSIGCISASVYDTAWVSMISKVIDGCRRWLFSHSFQYILDKQLSDGGWQCYASDPDGIINTVATLLAILRTKKIILSTLICVFLGMVKMEFIEQLNI